MRLGDCYAERSPAKQSPLNAPERRRTPIRYRRATTSTTSTKATTSSSCVRSRRSTAMNLEATLRTTASPSAVVGYVAELDKYPQWMSLVHAATRVPEAVEPTWDVELRAKVGPFARSKRLRMVRTQCDQGATTRIVFERKETDGRRHAAWRLTVTVQGPVGASQSSTVSQPAETQLAMTLHYDGKYFVSVVESILRQSIDAGRERLGQLLAG
jgi:hypothetical protein